MPSYEFFEHTADIGIRANGITLARAFEAAGLALTDLMTGGTAAGEGEKEIAFEIESIDIEGLLVGFLSELIYRFDTDGAVVTALHVTLESARRLQARATIEALDESRHGGGTPAKGVSYHMIEVVPGRDGSPCHVQVLIDV